MSRPVWVLAAFLAAGFSCSWAADSGCRVEYVGGTLSQFAGRTQGRIHVTDPEVLVFETKKAGLEVPFDRVNLLEYGQQAGRRIVLAVAISPLLLLSKSRRHFLTVSFRDEAGKQQAMVLRIDKSDVRALLAGMEARTGLKVDYLDEEARKIGGGV